MISRRERLVRQIKTLGLDPSEDELCVATLRDDLCSSNANVAVGAVLGLERIGTDEATDALIDYLKMKPGPNLTMVVVSLKRLHAGRAVPSLVRCLERQDEELRHGQKRLLILALGEMPHVSAVPVLSASLRHRSYRVRNAAAWALAQIRAPESAAALAAASNELSWFRALPARRGLRTRTRRADHG